MFTARVRSKREGNIYTWECLSVHHWGGGTPILPDGYPHLVTGRTYPICPAPSSWNWMEVHLELDGVLTSPHPPSGDWSTLCCRQYASCGFPQEDFLVLVCLSTGVQSGFSPGVGTSWSCLGDGGGLFRQDPPPGQDKGLIRYAADGTPLAITQKDFLVYSFFTC